MYIKSSILCNEKDAGQIRKNPFISGVFDAFVYSTLDKPIWSLAPVCHFPRQAYIFCLLKMRYITVAKRTRMTRSATQPQGTLAREK